MVKKAVIFIGTLVILVGVFNFIKYVSDYNELAGYGKGYVWGNVILMTMGFALVYFVLKKGDTK